MTRHSKNNTANPIFTYHERKKVKDFNTLKQRLGTDSMRRCEQCWLCLSSAIKPVCTPLGYVYCKECILNCFAKQMEDHKRELQKWELQCAQKELMDQEKKNGELESRKRKIITESVYGVTTVKAPRKDDSTSSRLSEKTAGSKDSNFWVSGRAEPSNTGNEPPSGSPPKPKLTMKCPITGKPLKMKELVDMQPESSPESDDPGSGQVWICSVSQKPILHHPAVLDPKTGRVILKRYISEPEDSKQSQYIWLIPGGTSFSAHNSVYASKYRPALL